MRLGRLAMIAVALASSGVVAASDAPRHIVRPQAPGASVPPLSEAVLVGNTLYIAGHLGTDPNTGQAAQKPEIEAKLVMDAIVATLGSAGMTPDDLVSVTVYCTDLKLYDSFNTVYKTYFHGQFPARAFVGVAALVRGAHFEVQGIAVKSPAPR